MFVNCGTGFEFSFGAVGSTLSSSISGDNAVFMLKPEANGEARDDLRCAICGDSFGPRTGCCDAKEPGIATEDLLEVGADISEGSTIDSRLTPVELPESLAAAPVFHDVPLSNDTDFFFVFGFITGVARGPNSSSSSSIATVCGKTKG